MSKPSTAQLRELAQAAGRPFEVAVAVLILSSLLVGLSPRLGFHPDTGCLFDYNESRTTLTKSIFNPVIEEECLELLVPRFREPALALVAAVKKYGSTRKSSEASCR